MFQIFRRCKHRATSAALRPGQEIYLGTVKGEDKDIIVVMVGSVIVHVSTSKEEPSLSNTTLCAAVPRSHLISRYAAL